MADRGSLVVGLDGSDTSLIALDWAAAEATERGWALHLVSAFLPRIPEVAYSGGLQVASAGREAAEKIFETARRRLTDGGHGDLTISTAAREGFPRRVLLWEADRAHGLVVGRHGTGRLADLLLGSTSLACATHSTGTPVVIVPRSWQLRTGTESQRLVVVGVDGSVRGRAAVEYAFTVAAAWGASLRAVLAYDIASDASRYLAEALAGWVSTYPDVPVTRTIEMGHPAQAIRAHSADADLVVIGGRGHSEVTGMLLGSVARAVLYLVDRPTAVVHERTGRRS
ncbi:MAG TPA: universal stress protein [Jiangellaceae bacterium]|nr:universal stress protein [Jiangellaceae bacterium]